MIEISKVSNIISGDHYNFSHRKKELDERSIGKLSFIGGLRFRFGQNSDALEFKVFLKEFVESLMQDHKLYFIYVEKKPKIINKIRSHKRLLYPHKKALGENNVFEEEIKLGERLSLLASIVKIESENIKYVIDNLVNSMFTFCYLVEKGKRSFPKNKNEFVKKVLQEDLLSQKIIDLDILRLTKDLINNNSALFRIRGDGRDNQFIELFIPANKLEAQYHSIKEEVQNKFYLKN